MQSKWLGCRYCTADIVREPHHWGDYISKVAGCSLADFILLTAEGMRLPIGRHNAANRAGDAETAPFLIGEMSSVDLTVPFWRGLTMVFDISREQELQLHWCAVCRRHALQQVSLSRPCNIRQAVSDPQTDLSKVHVGSEMP